jgi:hypothetical protein
MAKPGESKKRARRAPDAVAPRLPLLTRAQAALYVFDRLALPSLIRAGRCQMIEGHRHFDRADLDAWLDEQRSVPSLVARAMESLEDIEVVVPRPKSGLTQIAELLLEALERPDPDEEPPLPPTLPKPKRKPKK